MIGWVVAVCCFEAMDKMCETSSKRLLKAIELWRQDGGIFLLLGNVPYKRGSRSLTDLAKELLMAQGIPEGAIHIPGGHDTFSSAWATKKYLQNHHIRLEKLVHVSSTWYLEVLDPVWKYIFRKEHIPIVSVAVAGTGGETTRKRYERYARAVNAFRRWGLLGVCGWIKSAVQAPRKRGFRWKGCA